MVNQAEEKVAAFYNGVGWEQDGEVTEDAKRFEDLRPAARQYLSRCRLRLLRYIPEHGEKMLDMASGPIQYREYLEYSRNFRLRYCVDLSKTALQAAETKLGERGVYLHGSFFDLGLEEDMFDCTISLHTVYHMDKDRQAEAVRKLLAVTKPGKPVIIVYSNPKPLMRWMKLPLKLLQPRKLVQELKSRWLQGSSNAPKRPGLYFHAHPLEWWQQFEDAASVQIHPWRTLASIHQKALIPDNRIGKWLFEQLYHLEERFPGFFARQAQYPLILLIKK